MRSRMIRLCAITLLTAQTIAIAQKTQVSVKKGKVIAETPTTVDQFATEQGHEATVYLQALQVPTQAHLIGIVAFVRGFPSYGRALEIKVAVVDGVTVGDLLERDL